MFEYHSPTDYLHSIHKLAPAYTSRISNNWINAAVVSTSSFPYTSITTPNTPYKAYSMQAPIL